MTPGGQESPRARWEAIEGSGERSEIRTETKITAFHSLLPDSWALGKGTLSKGQM